MPPQPRISGQETEVIISVDNETVSSITAVKSCDFTWKFTLKEEDYLGETGPRFDEFFGGVSGRIEFDMEDIECLEVAEAIKTRAQNRNISTDISIRTVLQFPNGDRAIINVRAAFFEDIPLGFASRTDYGKMTLSYRADDASVVSR
jgi:hypothetical protein